MKKNQYWIYRNKDEGPRSKYLLYQGVHPVRHRAAGRDFYMVALGDYGVIGRFSPKNFNRRSHKGLHIRPGGIMEVLYRETKRGMEIVPANGYRTRKVDKR
ncbi:MAG: hypothetical protein IID32_06795 [Planctomycetes bacterium]|nr:hypothetical protein [Planctomycetota bacterium]